MTWIYGDRPVDEVELRLSSGEDGDTTLELEHATVLTQVEWEGRSVDVITGLGPGWEPALFALEMYLRGELPDAVASEWQGESPPTELTELINESTRIWVTLVESAGTSSERASGPA